MNNKVKEEVAGFSNYAKEILDVQRTQLESVKQDHLLSDKLTRMKVFNEHHEELKQKLQQRIAASLEASHSLPREQYNKLDRALNNVYAECINDYLCIPFVKDKD